MLSLDISFDPVCLLKDKLMDRKAISPSPVEVLYLQLEKLGSNLNPLKKNISERLINFNDCKTGALQSSIRYICWGWEHFIRQVKFCHQNTY